MPSTVTELFGHLHPLVLHLPIGLLVGLVLVELAALALDQEVPRAVRGALVLATALSGVVTAASGWVLAEGGGYPEEIVDRHRLLGIAVACGACVVAGLFLAFGGGRRPYLQPLYRVALLVTAGVTVPAGHYGATMTHGRNYLDWSVLLGGQEDTEHDGEEPVEHEHDTDGQPPAEADPAPPEPSTYAARIAPLLEAKCSRCHGETRQKGELRLDTAAGIQRGGTSGPVVLAEDPASSRILERTRLPLEHDDHMPPEGKPQLSPAELDLLEAWVLAGAPFEGQVEVESVGEGGSPSESAQEDDERSAARDAEPPRADPDALARLEEALIHVEERVPGTGGLWVDASAVATTLDDARAAELLAPVADFVVDLNLSRSGAGPETLALCARMPRLERLELSGVSLAPDALTPLTAHPALTDFVLTRTDVGGGAVDTLLTLPALRRVYLWEAGVGPDALDRLAAERDDLAVETGTLVAAAVLEEEPQLVFTSDRPLPGAPSTALTPTNTTCPVSGGPIDPRYLVVHDGQVLAFCCPDCPTRFWTTDG